MQYDPLKDRISALINTFPPLRKAFYLLMDLTLLRQRHVKRAIRNHLGSRPLLHAYDAGAGYCQYSWYFLRHWPCCQVHASDLKSDFLRQFQDFLPGDLLPRFSSQAADLQSYIPNGSYDLITAIDILEHIPDDIAVMRNFHTALKKGGLLVISTPSDTDEAARFTEEHVRPGYNKAELENKLKSVGFTIRQSSYTYGRWGSLSWRLLIKRPMQMIGSTRLALLVLPFYLLAIYPMAFILMRMDLAANNKTGTGLLVVAGKT